MGQRRLWCCTAAVGEHTTVELTDRSRRSSQTQEWKAPFAVLFPVKILAVVRRSRMQAT